MEMETSMINPHPAAIDEQMRRKDRKNHIERRKQRQEMRKENPNHHFSRK